MAIVVILPKQGQSVESCIITEIKKKKGDAVKKGEILFAYETDKATFEEESPTDGVVLECFYNDGDEVPVLLNMMVIGQPGEDYAGLLGGEISGKEQELKLLMPE
ncbi:MAG: biotin/lipoyl-containing protein [Paludibacter sp.]|nr:biotin/lipoyl-containing protein [Paludibacter sp.]